MENRVLDISWPTILKLSLAFLCFYIIFLIREILIWFIFALIISVLFNPAINFLQRLKVPRILATIFIYVSIFGVLGLLVYWTVPMFIIEVQQFSQLFPQYFETIAPPLRAIGVEAFENMETFTLELHDMLEDASSGFFDALGIFFDGLRSALFVLSIALFLSLEERGFEKVVVLLSPKKYESYVLALWKRSQTKVAGWFGSRILTALFVGMAVYATLHLFDVEYSASLSFLAGVLDLIPILGPIVAGFIICIFVGMDSLLKALFILIAFILIQQIEGLILSPVLTNKFVGLPPVLVLISLSIGGTIFGIMGAILAIPLAGIIFEFLRDFLKKKKEGPIVS